MSPSSQSFRVAIVGGGLCGLTCAIPLLKAGVDVQVYEGAHKFAEIGAGVCLGQNAINILTKLGIYNDVYNNTLKPEPEDDMGPSSAPHQPVPPRGLDNMNGWFKYVAGEGDNEELCDYAAKDNVAQGVHRAVFLETLIAHVDPARTHFHKRCTHLTEGPSGTTIHFADGTSAEADVVLGADGIKSAVRRFVAGTAGAPVDPHLKHSGSVAYRALVPAAVAAAAGCTVDYGARPLCVVGRDKHFIIFTVRGGTMINIAAFVTDPARATPATWVAPPAAGGEDVAPAVVLKAYEEWGPEMTRLLSCVTAAKKWDINVVHPPLAPSAWTRGAVAILGDAAHGMQPHLGAGAGQGLEDAYLLGRLLAHAQTSRANVSDVLKAYAAVRQPRAHRVWEGSRRAGDIYEFRAGEAIEVAELRRLSGYVWDHAVDADVEAAEAMLVREGVFAA